MGRGVGELVGLNVTGAFDGEAEGDRDGDEVVLVKHAQMTSLGRLHWYASTLIHCELVAVRLPYWALVVPSELLQSGPLEP